GLSTVVLVVVAIGLRFGVPIYQQQLAIRDVERLRGSVPTEHVEPERLRDWVGDERMKGFAEVKIIRLGGSEIGDEGLSRLSVFKDLESLDLASVPITDAGLVHLKRLTRLKELWLSDTSVTDAGLGYLKGMANLLALGLDGTQVTDNGLADLE